MCSLAGRLLKTSVCLPLLLALNLSLTSCAKIRSVSNDLQFLTSSPTPSATPTPTPEPTATPTPEPTATPTPEPTATPTPEPTATPTPEPTATPTPEPTATPTPEPTATPTPEPTATPTPEPTATPTPEPTATPTPNPKFGLPVTKIEVVVGDDAPPLQAFDLSGTNTGKAMSVTNIGSLPAGLTYNSTTGIITGTPTQAGDYNVEVCYVENSLTTSTCKTVLYSILEEKTISPSNQRTSSTADAGCTSSSGIGSLADPVLISTVSDLNTCVRTYPRAAFKLANDISLSGYPGTNSSDSFNPLPFFYGNFDGSGYKIQDWTWNISNSGLGIVHYNGLFKGIGMNAVVKNLTLKNISLTLPLVDSGTYSSANGILAGFIRGGFAFNITVENSTINCARSCAGLVGGTLNPKITNPSNADPSTDYKDGYLNRIKMNSITVNSNAGWSYAGGVAGGYNAPFRVSNTKVTGATIASGNSVGGILGSHLYGGAPSAATTSDSRVWIDRCSTAGSINDYPGNNAAFMGGLVGFMRGNDVITNSFSIMTLNSTDVSLGGLVGNIEASVNNVKESIIAHSYFAGSVNGSTGDRGLLIGDNYAAWSGTFTGENGIHLVHNKVQTQGSYGIIGGSAVSKINVINNSTETFTNLPNDWFDSSKFVGWLNSIWQFFTNAKPDLI